MENLKEFMLLFRMQQTNTKPTKAQIETMHQQWQKFIRTIASQDKLVQVSRLGFEGALIHSNQSTENIFFVENGFFVSGNLIIKAKTIEEVIEMSKNCPVLFSGGIVEIRATIPMN